MEQREPNLDEDDCIARRLIAKHGGSCPSCAYDLAGLEGLTCPECGHRLRLRELWGHQNVLDARRAAGVRAFGWAVSALALGIAAAFATAVSLGTSSLNTWPVVLGLWVVVVMMGRRAWRVRAAGSAAGRPPQPVNPGQPAEPGQAQGLEREEGFARGRGDA